MVWVTAFITYFLFATWKNNLDTFMIMDFAIFGMLFSLVALYLGFIYFFARNSWFDWIFRIIPSCTLYFLTRCLISKLNKKTERIEA